MLKFNKDVDVTDILLPTFTSCAANKVDPRAFLLGHNVVIQQPEPTIPTP